MLYRCANIDGATHRAHWQHQRAGATQRLRKHQVGRALQNLPCCCAKLHADIIRMVFDEEQLRQRVSALGRQVKDTCSASELASRLHFNFETTSRPTLDVWVQAGCCRLLSKTACGCWGTSTFCTICILSLAVQFCTCTSLTPPCPQTLTGSFVFLAGAQLRSALALPS